MHKMTEDAQYDTKQPTSGTALGRRIGRNMNWKKNVLNVFIFLQPHLEFRGKTYISTNLYVKLFLNFKNNLHPHLKDF